MSALPYISLSEKKWVLASIVVGDKNTSHPDFAFFCKSKAEALKKRAAEVLKEGELSINFNTQVSAFFVKKINMTTANFKKEKAVRERGFTLYEFKGNFYYGSQEISAFGSFKWVYEDTRCDKQTVRENYYSKYTEDWLEIEN